MGRNTRIHVKQGEKLYLEHDIDQLDKEEQRMAMESDERRVGSRIP